MFLLKSLAFGNTQFWGAAHRRVEAENLQSGLATLKAFTTSLLLIFRRNFRACTPRRIETLSLPGVALLISGEKKDLSLGIQPLLLRVLPTLSGQQ